MKIFKILMLGSLALFSTHSYAAQCSAECAFLDLEKPGLPQSLPGSPVITSTDFKTLNDSCRAMVAGYANTQVLKKNVTLDQIPSVNLLIRSTWATHDAIEKLEKEGVKVAVVLRGIVGRITSGNFGSGDLIGFPTEVEACK